MPAYEVRIGERVVQVTLRRAADGLLVRVDDGPDEPVELRPVRGALYALNVGSRVSEVLAAPGSNGAVRLAVGGGEFEATVVDEAHARLASVAGARAGAHAHLELKAPMPGLLVRVLCTVGDEVPAGQPLVVLQAMKMENELSLPRAGKVTRVMAEPGQTVEQGQTLVVLE